MDKCQAGADLLQIKWLGSDSVACRKDWLEWGPRTGEGRDQAFTRCRGTAAFVIFAVTEGNDIDLPLTQPFYSIS